jgi:hypothetical protein
LERIGEFLEKLTYYKGGIMNDNIVSSKVGKVKKKFKGKRWNNYRVYWR